MFAPLVEWFKAGLYLMVGMIIVLLHVLHGVEASIGLSGLRSCLVSSLVFVTVTGLSLWRRLSGPSGRGACETASLSQHYSDL